MAGFPSFAGLGHGMGAEECVHGASVPVARTPAAGHDRGSLHEASL